ncbi:HAD hydrolase-like protein [Pseudonocardia sp. NPDC049154]|uniref:HAD hydrolase-like protein n=1 Tax=Pseudonocardia sp. NPDC049154 TaxID=3155501 RepID=UPI0033EAA451
MRRRALAARLVGDSVTDIQAARAAGTAAIAFADKPGKDRALRSFEPDALITSMDENLTLRNDRRQDQRVHTWAS